MKKRNVEIVEYDENWIFEFESEAKVLSKILNQEILKIYHIGSTSIPGMSAKPIIDILIEVKDINNIDKYNPEFIDLGYTPMGEYGINGRRFFYKGNPQRTHHIHIFNTGDANIERHINFRDYMISHKDDANRYAELKAELANKYKDDIEKYCNGKDDFIENIDKKATHWKDSIHEYIIKTQRLGLRKWKDLDYQPFSNINKDPQVMEFFPKTLTNQESDVLIDKFRAHFDKHGFGVYVVEDIITKEFIGCIGFNIPDFKSNFMPCVEILWRIGAEFWGKGYATEAAKACLEYAFEKLRLEEIVSFTPVINKRSERVMQKIGMKIQGEFMHPKIAEDHKLCLFVLYKISKSDFLDNRTAIDEETYSVEPKRQ